MDGILSGRKEVMLFSDIHPGKSKMKGRIKIKVVKENKGYSATSIIKKHFIATESDTFEELRKKIELMEKKYDGQFRVVFNALKKLMEPSPEKPKRQIGFHHE